jgi:uncharacterized alpha-E superfamily protein
VLARIAQELFWLARDVIRAEDTARMLDGAFHADVAGSPGERGMALSWQGVLAVIGAKPTVLGAAEREGSEAGPPTPLLVTAGRLEIAPLLTLDTDNPASIVSCVHRARERARTLRDVISTEMWEALNGFYLSLARYDLRAALATGPYSVYQEVKERCSLFWGLMDKTMLNDEAKSFLDAGAGIEEADMVLRMLRVALTGEGSPSLSGLATSDHPTEALALLQAVGGFRAFLRSARQSPDLRLVSRFMLYEAAYPGSVVASLNLLRDSLQTADASPRSAPPVLRVGRLIADLELQQRSPDPGGGMVELLARCSDELELIDRDIYDRYFAVAATTALHI